MGEGLGSLTIAGVDVNAAQPTLFPAFQEYCDVEIGQSRLGFISHDN